MTHMIVNWINCNLYCGNIANLLNPQPWRYCDNYTNQNFYTENWNLKKLKQKEWKIFIQIAIITFKNIAKIDSLKTSDPLSPGDIAFGEKSTKEAEKLYRKA